MPYGQRNYGADELLANCAGALSCVGGEGARLSADF